MMVACLCLHTQPQMLRNAMYHSSDMFACIGETVDTVREAMALCLCQREAHRWRLLQWLCYLMGGAMGAADGGNMQLLMMHINSLAWWEQQGHEPKGRHS